MCYYNYRLFRTNTKFISPAHNQQLMHSFRCGHCPECLEQSRKEWYLRSVYEYTDTIRSGGYMLFDTLTYKEDTIPRVSHYFDIDPQYDGYCFDYTHITNFLKKLRITLQRSGYDAKDNLRYFYATEYGEHNTHRSHIHLLFFVRNSFIAPCQLSQYISQCWNFGRTDGLPYKSKYYVLSHNVVHSGMSNSIRVCSYVSKYVCKSLRFTDSLNSKVVNVMKSIYKKNARVYLSDVRFKFDYTDQVESAKLIYDYSDFDSWSRSPLGKELFRAVKRRLDMFHNQSLGYGLSALVHDSQYYIDNPYLVVADSDKVVLKISLPLYFKRKLFQEQVQFNGARFWQRNIQGRTFYNKFRSKLVKHMLDRFDAVQLNIHESFDSQKLVRYLLFQRGYSKDYLVDSPLLVSQVDSLPDVFFNYSSSSDLRHFKFPLITDIWLGSSQTSYECDVSQGYPFELYVQNKVFLDPDQEKLIDRINALLYKSKIAAFKSERKKEQLNDLFNSCFS